MDRIEKDEYGLDELVIEDASLVHIERMDTNSVWIGIYKNDTRVSLFLTASAGEGPGHLTVPIRVSDGDGNLEEFFK